MMKTRWHFFAVALVVAAALTAPGCADSGSEGEQASNPTTPPPPPPPVSGGDAAENQGNAAERSPAENEGNEAVVAEVGFGKKGHYDSDNYIAVAVSAQFRAQERIMLARITQAMQQYKAVHGEYPQTQEEFWEKIIEAHGIRMPDLKPGEKFLYDPDLAKETNAEKSLKILRPK